LVFLTMKEMRFFGSVAGKNSKREGSGSRSTGGEAAKEEKKATCLP